MAPDHPALIKQSASHAVLKPMKALDADGNEKAAFKMTTNYKSIPNPSIATNYRNLKSSFPS